MTHRAVTFAGYGDPEVLDIIDLPEAHAGPGHVRVRMRAAGIQPFDCAFRRGDLAGFMTASFPQILGNDFAGVIDEVGPGVNAFAEGDEVLGYCTLEAHAELIVVDADHIVHRPAAMPCAISASVQVTRCSCTLQPVGWAPWPCNSPAPGVRA